MSSVKSRRPRTLAALALFVALPLAYRLGFVPLPPIPALWVLGLYCLAHLMTDATFDRNKLWNPRPLRRSLAGWQRP